MKRCKDCKCEHIKTETGYRCIPKRIINPATSLYLPGECILRGISNKNGDCSDYTRKWYKFWRSK